MPGNSDQHDSSGNQQDSSGNQSQDQEQDQEHQHYHYSKDVSGNYHQDPSGNYKQDPSGNYITNYSIMDVSYTVIGSTQVASFCADDTPLPTVVPLVVIDSSSATVGIGYQIVEQVGKDASGAFVDRTTFDTTHPELYDPQIHENLSQVITSYDDEQNHSQSAVLLAQISGYAAQIQCSDFHGKGSIDDYTALFQAAGRIATESKQMELDIDIDGFNEFADAADQLSELFEGFILKLQNVNIITDVSFLTSISIALSKIVNLSNIFGRFKQTILDTSVIQFPKSAHDTKVVIEGVMSEVNCAMQYINYFVSPTDTGLVDAQLSAAEKNIITQSVATIENWNTLCEHGVSIAMANNPDVQYIQTANTQLKQTTVTLKNTVATLKSKLAAFNITC